MSEEMTPQASLTISEHGLTFYVPATNEMVALPVKDLIGDGPTLLAWAQVLLLKDLVERQAQLASVLGQLAQVMSAAQQRAVVQQQPDIDTILKKTVALLKEHGK